METFPYPTCCALKCKPFRRSGPNNSDQQTMEKIHNMRTTATQKNIEIQGVPKHLNRTPRQKVPEDFHDSSSSRQSQDQVPSTCNKQTCYDPQLQGIFIWLCHLSHDPFAATSLDHRYTLVQIKCMTFQDMTTVRTIAYLVQ